MYLYMSSVKRMYNYKLEKKRKRRTMEETINYQYIAQTHEYSTTVYTRGDLCEELVYTSGAYELD